MELIIKVEPRDIKVVENTPYIMFKGHLEFKGGPKILIHCYKDKLALKGTYFEEYEVANIVYIKGTEQDTDTWFTKVELSSLWCAEEKEEGGN